VHDHNDHSSDEHSSKAKDRVVRGDEPQALLLGGGSGSQWRMLSSASPGAQGSWAVHAGICEGPVAQGGEQNTEPGT